MSSESIKLIYKEARTKGVDYLGPFLLIFLVVSVFGYLYTDTQKKLMNVAYTEQKCNPRYLFFSGFLNPLHKDPWSTTQTNFDRCVATYVYKDPQLSKEIKRNQRYIKQHDGEMKQNLSKTTIGLDEIHKQWEDVKEKKDKEVQRYKSEANGIFEKQGYMHGTLADKTTQMFQVIKSVILYIQGILVYRVSKHKEDLAIDKRHDEFMGRYAAIYIKYKAAFESLDKKEWTNSINHARDAMRDYQKLDIELNEFMTDHYYQIEDITESCYHLKYNLDDDACEEQIFPNITKPLIDYFPILKNAFTV
jgi:ABC-type multidrug transport system fused ATPase/permease subunit